VRPTFDTKSLAIEVHIFDFDEDIYGEEITVYFISKMRGEKKFQNAESLIKQIHADIKAARGILAQQQERAPLSQ
jgi:riboflavin kinase/FMN adenylyltransferase